MLRAASASKPTAVYTLAQSAVAVSCPADTTEDVLATITIPGGTVGPNSSIRVTAYFSYTNSANIKSLNIKLGATFFYGQTFTTTTNNRAQVVIANRGSTSSQVGLGPTGGTGGWGSGTGTVPTSSLDMTASQAITITGQKALGTETLTLEGYSVEILP